MQVDVLQEPASFEMDIEDAEYPTEEEGKTTENPVLTKQVNY